MTYLKIETIEDVNFQDILNDYIDMFTRRYLVVQTNYKKLEQFEIRFNKSDLHHLLGFHKVQDSNVSATKTLYMILEGKLTLESIRRHHQFKDMKSRLINYNFLHKCFIDQDVQLCIIPNSKKNPQKLDVVFQDIHNHHTVLIGLKKVRNYYVPATLYETNSKNVYGSQRRTKVTSMEWNSY